MFRLSSVDLRPTGRNSRSPRSAPEVASLGKIVNHPSDHDETRGGWIRKPPCWEVRLGGDLSAFTSPTPQVEKEN